MNNEINERNSDVQGRGHIYPVSTEPLPLPGVSRPEFDIHEREHPPAYETSSFEGLPGAVHGNPNIV